MAPKDGLNFDFIVDFVEPLVWEATGTHLSENIGGPKDSKSTSDLPRDLLCCVSAVAL